MSKISEFCRSIIPAFIEEQVCNFPEWAADKLYAPIERKIEAKINQIQDDIYYKITHNAEFEAEESGKDWITYCRSGLLGRGQRWTAADFIDRASMPS